MILISPNGAAWFPFPGAWQLRFATIEPCGHARCAYQGGHIVEAMVYPCAAMARRVEDRLRYLEKAR